MTQLVEGERVMTVARRHWLTIVRPLAPAIALAMAILAAAAIVGGAPSDLRVLLALLVLAAVGAWSLAVVLRWSCTSFTLTDQRIILATGVLSRSSKVVSLDRVQDVSTRQSLLGRALGFGRVEIEAAGAGARQCIEPLADPVGFRDLVFAQTERIRRSRIRA